MQRIVLFLNWIVLSIAWIGMLFFMFTSIIEKRWRSVGIISIIFIPMTGFFYLILFERLSLPVWFLLALPISTGILFLLLNFPFGSNKPLNATGELTRVDERDAIFHRFYRIQPGMKEFVVYYKSHPEHIEIDEKIRAMPNLNEPGSRSFNPLTSKMNAATFDVIEKITRDIDWAPKSKPLNVTPEGISCRIKGFSHYLGADLVGITKLNPAYIYSHIGRSPGNWGEPIELDHKFAIAIALEMDFDMVRYAPHHVSTTETAFKYFEAAKIAMILSRYIQMLGYEARAHVDGNYRVMCVPIAADAGLGELGRLGLLITPEFGPRIRLAIVTTNLPLKCDKPIAFGVQDFCSFCKKCSRNCPSAAISSGDKKIHNGIEKWRSNQESCYKYWRLQGSDCSLCLKVCPYSHPKSLIHDLVRQAIRKNGLSRRLALMADDLFYGKRPAFNQSFPRWHEPAR